MKGGFDDFKITSNMLFVKVGGDDYFIDYLTGNVKKNFQKSLIMKRSIFILPEESEKNKRKVFLAWIVNLHKLDHRYKKDKLLSDAIAFSHLPINIQISATNAAVVVRKAYALFEKNIFIIRCYQKQIPLFSYLKSLLKQDCTFAETSFELKVFVSDKQNAVKIEKFLSLRPGIGLEVYQTMYSKNDLKRFLSFFEGINTETVTVDLEKLRRFSILGFNGEVSIEIVKKRYLELAKKYHPDLHMTKSVYEQSIIEKKFLSIKEAYEFLRG